MLLFSYAIIFLQHQVKLSSQLLDDSRENIKQDEFYSFIGDIFNEIAQYFEISMYF